MARFVKTRRGSVVPVAVILAAVLAGRSWAGPGDALLRGDYEDAEEGFRAQLSLAPGDADAALGLAHSLEMRGMYDEAKQGLRDAGKHGEDPRLGARLGRIEAATGRFDEAAAAFRDVLARSPENLAALVGLGDVLVESGRRDDAVPVYEKVIDLYRDLSGEEARRLPATDFVEFARAAIGLRRYRDAYPTLLEQAHEVDKECLDFYIVAGDLFISRYSWPDARSFFEDARKINPRDPRVNSGLAEATLVDFQLSSPRFGKVEKLLADVFAVNLRFPRAHIIRGDLHQADGNMAAAIASYEKALEVNPKDITARAKIASVAHLCGDGQRFEREEAEALRINPKGARFYWIVAREIETRYRYPEVVAMCEKGLRVDPDYWPILATMGIGCLRVCRYADGERYVRLAFDKDPYNVWAYNTGLLIDHMDENHAVIARGELVFHLPKADAEVLVAYLGPLLEDARERLGEKYRADLEGPTHVEVFNEHRWFSARTVGLPGLSAAGASFGRLVTLASPKAFPEHWGVVAWHEFTHTVTAQKSRFRIPRWLAEGISVYEEGFSRPGWGRDFDVDFVDAVYRGEVPEIEGFEAWFSRPRDPAQIMLGYYMSSVVVEYMEKTYGHDRVLALLDAYGRDRSSAGAFQDAFKVDLASFDRGIRTYAQARARMMGIAPSYTEADIERFRALSRKEPERAEHFAGLAWGYQFRLQRIDPRSYRAQGAEVDRDANIERALEIDPGQPDALALRGIVSYSRGNPKGAAADLERAVDVNAENEVNKGTRFRYRGLLALGGAYAKLDRIPDAIEALERARALFPWGISGGPENVCFQLDALYKKSGEVEKGTRCLEALAAVHHKDRRSREILRKRYREGGDDRSLVRVLEDLVLMDPYTLEPHRELAAAAERVREYRTAIREHGVILAILARIEGSSSADTLTALARCHLALRERKEAADWARKALEVDPGGEEAKRILKEASEGL